MCMVIPNVIPKNKRKKILFTKIVIHSKKTPTISQSNVIKWNYYKLGKRAIAKGRRNPLTGIPTLTDEIIHGWFADFKYGINAIFKGIPVVESPAYGELGFRSATPIAFLHIKGFNARIYYCDKTLENEILEIFENSGLHHNSHNVKMIFVKPKTTKKRK